MTITPPVLLASVITLFISCNDRGTGNKVQSKSRGGNKAFTVAILPFKNVDKELIGQLKKGMESKIDVQFVVLNEMDLPSSAFYQPRQRYIADSLLDFLVRANQRRYDKIIGVTTKDISTRKGEIVNWGILGLGSCPGESCVISSFRAGKQKVKPADFRRRMITLGLHELGHTFGLEHCPVDTCLMVDAEGKMKLDQGDSYCRGCLDYLSMLGIVRE